MRVAARSAVFFVLLAMLCTVTPAASADAAPSGPSAIAASRMLLDWLSALPDNAMRHKVVSGFFGGYGDDADFGVEASMAQQQTGDFPGILDCDYGFGPNNGLTSACNPTLETHAQAGGVVSVGVHWPNPAGGSINASMDVASFADVTNPATTAGAAFKARLDQAASGMRALADAGIPVLFRPFMEMNTASFWWGTNAADTPAQADARAGEFAALWRYVYGYLTGTQGLNNLLWVYAPGGWTALIAAQWPGGGYVDVDGFSYYSDDPLHPSIVATADYEQLLATGKPFALTEIGPQSQLAVPTVHPVTATSFGAAGPFDYTAFIDAVHVNFPQTSYFLAWNHEWSPVHSHGVGALLDDPWVVDRGGVDIATAPTGPPAALLNGFEDGTEGWAVGNTTDGPARSTAWAAEGVASLAADVNLAAGPAVLSHTGDMNLTGDTALSVVARATATGGSANLYVKTGANWTWFDSGPVPVGPAATRLTVNLARATQLADVREIGVVFTPAAGTTYGSGTVYIDDLVLSGPGTAVESFETGTDGWTKVGGTAAQGPWPVAGESAGLGQFALKANVDFATGPILLNKVGDTDMTGWTMLSADVSTAAWQNPTTPSTAKLYIRTGANWVWFDSGAVPVGPYGATLMLSLAGIPNLNDVREIGVVFTPPPSSAGTSAIYLDNIRHLTSNVS